jgi:hypothetical protein
LRKYRPKKGPKERESRVVSIAGFDIALKPRCD